MRAELRAITAERGIFTDALEELAREQAAAQASRDCFDLQGRAA
jgi:hypothetical protein